MAGGAPLVFLPGALGELEGSDEVAHRLGASRELIPITYGPDDRLEPLLDRIAAATDAPRFDLLGQSYGGWIAQCAARRFPQRVRRLVLSHSFILRPQDAWRFRLAGKLLRRVPIGLMRPLLLKRIGKALKPLRRRDPERVERQLTALAGSLAEPAMRAKLVAQQRCMLDSLERSFAELPEVRFDLPVLIIESDNDPLLPATARRALRNLYPTAQVLNFTGAGHISAMVETDAYAAGAEAFLGGRSGKRPRSPADAG